jgi:hypothetical protein
VLEVSDNTDRADKMQTAEKLQTEVRKSSRLWFRASSLINLNKNQLDAHLF